jgi:hypothetical protein
MAALVKGYGLAVEIRPPRRFVLMAVPLLPKPRWQPIANSDVVLECPRYGLGKGCGPALE